MSYLVELHTCGGSMGEAVEPIELVHVATEEEAELVAAAANDHPINNGYGDLWAIIVEVPEILSGVDGVTAMLNNYYFEDWEEDQDDE